jgi:polyhydroxyalkanoate synthesis regulator phasin
LVSTSVAVATRVVRGEEGNGVSITGGFALLCFAARKEAPMLDALRRYVEAGREALTPKRAEELARSLINQGQARKDQAAKLTRDLLDWSRKSSERFRDAVGREVSRQIGRAGLATKAEVESLKRRIRKLEAKKTSTRKPAARKATSSKKKR